MIAQPDAMISAAMRLRALAPYAFAAVLVFAGSSAALLSSVREGALAPEPSASPSAAPLVVPSMPQLSRAARLTFWRDDRLWVSNIDGSLRYAVARVTDLRRVSLTRWSADGSAVSFVDAGVSLGVVRTDGTRADVDLPLAVRDDGFRIADVRWSPDGRSVAATLLDPGSGRADAFVVRPFDPGQSWTRVTTLEDLFVGDWISNDEFLASTGLGAVGTVRADGIDEVRLLSGATGASPVIGPEGRIHFLVGRLPTVRDPSAPYVTASRASVWSVATDGSGARREAPWELNDLRLDARLPDGRYLVRRSSSWALGTVGEDVDLLPYDAGVIERLRVAPDGRTAFGFTADRIVRLDLARLAVTPPAGPAGAVSVFLDTGGEADVWFPRELSLARGGRRADDPTSAKYAFSLGAHVWQMQDGAATLLRPAPRLRRAFVPAPRWSPAGDRLALLEQAGVGSSITTFVPVVLAGSADPTRLDRAFAAGRSFAWSPDGSEIAFVADRRRLSGVGSDAQLEVRVLDPAGRATRAAIPGSEVAWTERGLLVLGDVDGAFGIRLVAEGGARILVTRDALVADPRTAVAGPSTSTLSGLEAARAASFVSTRLIVQDGVGQRTYLVVIGPDGAPAHYARVDGLSDVAWSATRPLVGYTLEVRTPSERAVVMTAQGEILSIESGRFAGWSPAGDWFYIARVEGLFAHPVGGGDAVRVGPAGAPVSAAPAT